MASGTLRPAATQRPPAVVELFDPPRERPGTDQRWRPSRPQADAELSQQQRSEKAVSDQCTNARVPGYKGFIPGAKSESVYGCTECNKGVAAAETEAWRRQQHQQRQRDAERRSQEGSMPWAQATRGESQAGATIGRYTIDGPGSGARELFEPTPGPSEHPLVSSRSRIVRNHWVPTVPGYTGHVPGKGPETVVGAGVMGTCMMAGRAIAERNFGQSPLPPEEQQDRLIRQMREHCSGKMPGYAGHMPRVHGESIFGARATAAGVLAADYCTNRVANPPPDGNICIPKKQLRI